jgi:hypothetical protein
VCRDRSRSGALGGAAAQRETISLLEAAERVILAQPKSDCQLEGPGTVPFHRHRAMAVGAQAKNLRNGSKTGRWKSQEEIAQVLLAADEILDY